MKKKILILTGFFCVGLLYAQVGINTTNPQGWFHVDPDKTAGTGDDVIVTNDGKLGISTLTPSALLEIKTAGTPANPISGFKLQDGNEGDGNVLVSDANGLATWKNIAPNEVITWVKGDKTNLLTYNDPNYSDTGADVVLPPGRWVLSVVMVVSGASGVPATFATPVFVSSTFADDFTIANIGGSLASVKSPNIEGSGLISAICWSATANIMIGTVVVYNTSSVNKTYHYVVGGTSSFGIPVPGYFLWIGSYAWSENNMVAYRIPINI